MLRLLRILLMVAVSVASVSTAQHVHAEQRPESHATHSGHAEHGGASGQEHGGDYDPMVCCPSFSIHCGVGAVLHAEIWNPVQRLPVANSQSPQYGTELADTLPEFEPPPPRS